MKTETFEMIAIYADNGKVIADIQGNILGKIVYIAKEATLDSFVEIDEIK